MKIRFLKTVFLFVAVLLSNQGAQAAASSFKGDALMVVYESAIYIPETNEVQFTLIFNQVPDLFTLDEYGRQRHSFQYFIIGDPSLPYPQKYDALVRGSEITESTLVIRSVLPPTDEPGSGGWGPLRGVVPYQLNETVLTFSAPLDMLSDHSQDGNFNSELMLLEYGATSDFVVSHTYIGSLPTQIDIVPGETPNQVNVGSTGQLSVAILGSDILKSSSVDSGSVQLGPNGASPIVRRQFGDVNQDGYKDVILTFAIQDIGITCDTESLSLTGQTIYGEPIDATDSIVVIGCQ